MASSEKTAQWNAFMKTPILNLKLRFCTATLVVLWFCSASIVSFAAGPPLGILDERNPRVQAVMNIQDQYTPALMRVPGVVGTATSLDAEGQVIVKVFTEYAGVAGIPAFLRNVPVEVEVTGMFTARQSSSTKDRWTRPVPIGVSTGHTDITAGTIGCRVVGGDGTLYALSNNHVYANSNDASLEDPVLQPGTYDGGTLADAIGWLHDYQPISFDGTPNVMDAAIARIDTDQVGFATPLNIGYGTPSNVDVLPAIGMSVQKVGRTTSWTTGTIDGINATMDICYETRGPIRCVKVARFVNQITITPGTFSAGGDSGSLIVTINNEPVGLLFAGSSTRTIANPIGPVLDRFGVTVDDGMGSYENPGTTEDEPPITAFTLHATGYKVKGRQHADLTWNGAISAQVDVYRNNDKIATVQNSGNYTDNIGAVGGGSYTYRACEAGTANCSNDVLVTF